MFRSELFALIFSVAVFNTFFFAIRFCIVTIFLLIKTEESISVSFSDLQINVGCIEQHLKKLYFLKSDYIYSEIEEGINCASEVEKFLLASNESIARDRAISASLGECIDSGFKFYKVHEYAMKMFVYTKSSNFENPHDQKGFQQALSDMDKIVIIVKFKMCPKIGLTSFQLSDVFDSLFSGGHNCSSDFCVCTFVTERMTSASLDAANDFFHTSVPCRFSIRKLRDSVNRELEDEFTFVLTQSESQKQCVKDKISASDYFVNYASASVLKHLSTASLSESVVERERNKFVKVLKFLYKDIMKCS